MIMIIRVLHFASGNVKGHCQSVDFAESSVKPTQCLLQVCVCVCVCCVQIHADKTESNTKCDS